MSGPEFGESACLIYEDPDEPIRQLSRLIQHHLTLGDRCVYVLNASADIRSTGSLTTFIPGADEAMERGALRFVGMVDLTGPDSPALSALTDRLRIEAIEAQKQGFSGLLVVIDVGSLAAHGSGTDEIRSFLTSSVEGAAIVCLYDATRSSEDLLRAALGSHSAVLVDSVFAPNPYRIATNDVSESDEPTNSVDQMLARIRELSRSNGASTVGVGPELDHSDVPAEDEILPLVIESVADALVRVDADGTIVGMNTVAEIMWQRERGNPIGRNIWEVFPEAVGGHTYQQIQRTTRDKRISHFETFSTVMDRWIEVTLVPNGDQIWISVRDISKRKQIEETLNARVRQQAAVAELGKQALVSTDIQSLMDNLVNAISQTLDVEFVKILELLPDHSGLRLVAGVGWEPSQMGTAIVDAGQESQAGYTLEVGGPVLVEDLPSETRFSGSQLLRDHGVNSGVSVPIPSSDGTYGVIGAHTARTRHFTQDDVNFVQSFANILATAIDHAKADELQRHYAAIVSSSDDAIMGETLDGLISGWNTSAEHIFGYTAAEAVGQPMTILYPPELQHEMRKLLDDIRNGRRVEQHESVRRTKDGRLIDVSVSLSPIRDRTGRIIGASKTLRDISQRKQAELERRAINQRLQLALEAGRMGTWDWDLGTDEVVWSSSLEQIHGLEHGTFEGTFEAFKHSIHPDDRDRVLETIQQALGDGEDYYIEYRNIRPDGSSQWLEARGRIVPGGRGRPDHLTGICTDVTEQVQFRQQVAQFAAAVMAERDRLQQVIEVIPEGIAITDAAGRIIMSNRAAHVIWGQPPPAGDLHGHDVFHAEDADDVPIPPEDLPASRSVLYGESVVGQQLSVRNATTGEFVPLLVNSAPIQDDEGNISGAVMTFQDITSFKEFERQKDEFLQTLSHDLKNPLTSVKGNAQFLRRRARVANAEFVPIIDRIEHSAVQAVQLIDELLDLTRLQMGRPVELIRGRTDLVYLVKQLAEQQAAISRFHIIRVEANEERLVGEMDEMRIARVLSNLLNNAIKYSPDNSEIVIRVERASDTPSWAEIHVQDHGIGIPAEDLPRLFERFRRGSNVQGQIRGSGLGLASAKQIVEQHGGWIDVESVEGEGSKFTVHLPLEDIPGQSSRQT